MLSLEGGNASHFTAAIIVAVQNALTKSFAILGHTGIQVVIVDSVLIWKKLFKRIINVLTYIAKADRVFTAIATFKAISMTGTCLTSDLF